MNIGKKIKKVRLSKAMTQSELAGEQITRNMLSQIENGVATPSVSTILYIAQKLGVPAGYLLAESENDFWYNKMLFIDYIKNAYANKEYQKCIDICKEKLHECDDEIYMILCESYFKLAEDSFKHARLSSSHKNFNTALQYAEKTIYNVDFIRTASFVYLEFIGELLPSLRFESKNSHYADANALIGTDIYTYMTAKKLVEKDLDDEALAIINQKDFCENVLASHIKAKLEMKRKNYIAAIEIFSSLTKTEGFESCDKPILFAIYSDMEICFRENKDFEHAYEYANKKSEIITEMGK